MRGINRFLVGILLAGAVGGAAVFARHSGSDSSVQAVDFAPPPPQHIGAPGTVLFARTPAPTRVVIAVGGRVRPSAGRTAHAATAAPAGLPTIPQVTRPRPVAAVQTETTAPSPAPAPVQAAAALVQTPQPPPRALAAVQLAPAQLAPVTSPDKAKGHGKHKGQDTPQAVNAPVTPPPPPDPAVPQFTPVEPSSDEAPASDDATGPGNGHGHASGHSNGRAEPDDN